MNRLKLENLLDNGKAAEGVLDPTQVRRLELDALVDTGATQLAIPAEAAEALGLRELKRSKVRLADGSTVDVPIVMDLLIELCGRQMICTAIVLPTGATALIGQIPLEELDLVVNPKTQSVTVNPASPDMPIVDLLRAS